MNFKLKPLSLAALATATVLSGCGTEEETIDKTVVFDEATKTGLWCKLPDIVQTVDADFHPLSESEIEKLQATALNITYPDGATEDQETAFAASFNAYEFDFSEADLYPVLGLTMEEKARQVTAKEEARQFKIGQKQDVIFGDQFDEWFDEWFATVPETDYLGASQRLAKAKLGMELSLSAANNGEEACYTPPTECPNYKVLDESGTYDCIVPEENPLADEQPAIPADAITASAEGKAVLFFRKNDGDYTDITIHTWNNANCTAYDEETSVTAWGSGKASTAVDDNYGMYWILDLVDEPSACGNMIVYNKSTGDKFITQNDAMVPLGKSGDVVFQNPDKISFFQEGIPANLMDGAYLANQHPLLGASSGSKSCDWGTTLDESGEACVGQAIPNCPEGTYAVGVGQVDIASKCVEEFDPETTFLLRGGFNGWGNPTDGTEFEKVAEGQYRKLFEYGAHPEDAPLTFGSDVAVEVKTAAGATFTFEQPTDEEGNNVDFVLDLNNIPANTVFTRADGTEVTLAEDGNMLTLPEGAETPEVTDLSIDIPAESMLKLAAGANHDDFACETDCFTSYNFKIADADWTEAATYGGVKGGDALVVGGGAKALTAGENVGQDIGINMQDTSIYKFAFTAEDPSAATLQVSLVPVKAFPSLSINSEATELTFGNGKYVLEGQALTAGTYNLVIADAANDYAVGVEAGNEMLSLDSPVAIVEGGEAMSITIAEDGEYDFILDYSDATAPTFYVIKGVPYGSNDIYIRGTMTGWGDPAPAEDQMVYNKDARTYSVVYGLEAGSNHNFKFASQAWSGPVDQGYAAYDFSTEGETVTDDFGNMQVVPSKSTAYQFVIDFNGKAKGEVKVVEAPIYIRGGIYGTGDWGADESMRLNFEPTTVETSDNEASHVYTGVVTTTGTGFFKIADSDWGNAIGFNYGASAEQEAAGTNVIELGVPMTLTGGNDSKNISFQEPAGEYKFVFDDVNKTLTVTATP